MRVEEFKLLIKLELIKKMGINLITPVVFHLNSKVSNDMIIHFIPAIESYLESFDKQKTTAEHKAALKKIIDEQVEVLGIGTIIEAPVRKEYDVSKQNRRMDSLARLLALNETDTPCVAVAFVQGNIVVSFNTPPKSTVEKAESLLKTKLEIILGFLQKGISLSESNSVDDIFKLIVDTRKELLSTGSHSMGMLPVNQRKRENMNKFIDVALGKLLTAVIKTPENGGFSNEDRETLLSGGNLDFLVPDREKEKALQSSFHAEQIIANYVTQQQSGTDQKIYVGISKLCCVACHDVLSENPAVAFRGSHGMTFPNVADTGKMEAMKYKQTTATGGVPFADDSDSEPESTDFKPARRQSRHRAVTSVKSDHRVNSFFAVHEYPLHKKADDVVEQTKNITANNEVLPDENKPVVPK